MLKILGIGAVLFFAVIVWRFRALAVLSRTMAPPPGIGANGKLAPCPSPLRCVSSDEDGEAHVAALAVSGSVEASTARVVDAIGKLGGNVRSQRPGYVHAEFRTPLWGFVDDFEVRIEPAGVAIRSASRVGKSDLGANRKRVEAFKALLST